jgi:serine/threonine protein kinase
MSKFRRQLHLLQGVLHRDLKPENMLYVTHGSEKHIKVAGMAAVFCVEE